MPESPEKRAVVAVRGGQRAEPIPRLDLGRGGEGLDVEPRLQGDGLVRRLAGPPVVGRTLRISGQEADAGALEGEGGRRDPILRPAQGRCRPPRIAGPLPEPGDCKPVLSGRGPSGLPLPAIEESVDVTGSWTGAQVEPTGKIASQSVVASLQQVVVHGTRHGLAGGRRRGRDDPRPEQGDGGRRPDGERPAAREALGGDRPHVSSTVC